jgi:hypothetical protein
MCLFRHKKALIGPPGPTGRPGAGDSRHLRAGARTCACSALADSDDGEFCNWLEYSVPDFFRITRPAER